MDKARAHILGSDDYSECGDWINFSPTEMGSLADACVETVGAQNQHLRHRLENLKNVTPLAKRAEKRFIMQLISYWFSRKWVDKARQSKQPPRTRPNTVVYLKKCDNCNDQLRCLTCDPIVPEVVT